MSLRIKLPRPSPVSALKLAEVVVNYGNAPFLNMGSFSTKKDADPFGGRGLVFRTLMDGGAVTIRHANF